MSDAIDTAKEFGRLTWEVLRFAVVASIPGTRTWKEVQEAKFQSRVEQKKREVELQKAIIREAILEAMEETRRNEAENA